MMNSWQFAQSRVLRLVLATARSPQWSGAEMIASATVVVIARDGATDTRAKSMRWTRYRALTTSAGSSGFHGVDTALFLAGRQMDVPEYNDCQRLLINTSEGPEPKPTH